MLNDKFTIYNTFILIILFALFVLQKSWSYHEPQTNVQLKKVPRYAWVTIVNGNTYSKGALVLAHSLRQSKTKYELVILTNDVENEENRARFELLRKFFDRVIHIEPGSPEIYNQKELEAIRWFPTYFLKIRILELLEYDKICIIGADYLVLKNIDSVFGCPAPCGVLDSWLWKANSKALSINADFMLLKPSISDSKGLIDLLYKVQWINKSLTRVLYDEFQIMHGPEDQGLFGVYYGTRWTVLSVNLAGLEIKQTCLTRPYLCNLTILHAIHFPASVPRPWEVLNATAAMSFEGIEFREYYDKYTESMLNLMETLTSDERLAFNRLSRIYTTPLRDARNDSTSNDLKKIIALWEMECVAARYGLSVLARRFSVKKRIEICEAKVRFYQDKINGSSVRN